MRSLLVMGYFHPEISHVTRILFTSLASSLLTDPVEIRKRTAQSDRGGYIVGNATKTAASDCYETSIRGQCLASMSNCPFECYNTTRDRPAYE